jgi:hypothetical protein
MLLEKANQTVGDKVLAARINGVLQDMYHEYAPEKDVVVRALDLLAKYNEQPLLVAKGFIEIERTVRTEPQRERIERLMRSIECQTTLPLKR